ncbi:hypothetical protein [uncultured Bosea sp.]|uniref:hypothetical protein n=1 Tax=uncultured Bosea sp. TaxID=211457 RepID=UPI0025FB2E8F|nr:hypothetical protein [uncultured Bosea sp.]
MARRPSQTRDDTASGFPAGGRRASGGKADRRRREREDIKVECGFENLPVTPREIELLCHYLGDQIDEILLGEE